MSRTRGVPTEFGFIECTVRNPQCQKRRVTARFCECESYSAHEIVLAVEQAKKDAVYAWDPEVY
jgi:hypothetical protein